MSSTQVVTALPEAQSSQPIRFAERYFYFCISLVIAAVVVYGFSHTVDRRLIHANPRPPSLLWVHAFVFTSWVVFYILQSALVRLRKVKLHRTLGWVGAGSVRLWSFLVSG